MAAAAAELLLAARRFGAPPTGRPRIATGAAARAGRHTGRLVAADTVRSSPLDPLVAAGAAS
jgi:hypothetical protein